MPPSDLDITRTAHRWIQQHGDDATAKARKMVEKMRLRGDADGADTWLRIIVAIGTLGTPRQTRGIDGQRLQTSSQRFRS
jgi:hypothetical protein